MHGYTHIFTTYIHTTQRLKPILENLCLMVIQKRRYEDASEGPLFSILQTTKQIIDQASEIDSQVTHCWNLGYGGC